MLYRKIKETIEYHLKNKDTILLIDGARQVGKSYIVRHTCKKMFKNYIEINMLDDSMNNRFFANTTSTSAFYLQLGMHYGSMLDKKNNTVIFIDEIQTYPYLLTLLKFLKQDGKYTFICSGSLLGIALSQTTSIPMGSVDILHMYPLDFEEFLYANNFSKESLEIIRNNLDDRTSLDKTVHESLLHLLKLYLLIGGLPAAVNEYVSSNNLTKVRNYHKQIHEYYKIDASKYDNENKLKIRKIYEMIPSNLENLKKRVVFKDIDNIKGKTYKHYQDEFEYLINSGITINVNAISNPTFPLIQSVRKNLIKLYLNDVGLLSSILYENNPNAILNDETSINLGSLYECFVAQELKAHDLTLYYYDNKAKGEVDFIINDYKTLSVLPLEVKSGKDYRIHRALDNLLNSQEHKILNGIVLSNNREIYTKDNVEYLPIYYAMFLGITSHEDVII